MCAVYEDRRWGEDQWHEDHWLHRDVSVDRQADQDVQSQYGKIIIPSVFFEMLILLEHAGFCVIIATYTYIDPIVYQ